jgi:hypothetical protein
MLTFSFFCITVEDPFELTNNIGRPVDKETLYDVRGEFIRASKILCAGAASGEEAGILAKLCERVSPPPSSSSRSSNNLAGMAALNDTASAIGYNGIGSVFSNLNSSYPHNSFAMTGGYSVHHASHPTSGSYQMQQVQTLQQYPSNQYLTGLTSKPHPWAPWHPQHQHHRSQWSSNGSSGFPSNPTPLNNTPLPHHNQSHFSIYQPHGGKRRW